MGRRTFIKTGGTVLAALFLQKKIFAMTQAAPQTFYFKDDGSIPNNKFPLLVYSNAFAQRGSKGGDWLEARFAGKSDGLIKVWQ